MTIHFQLIAGNGPVPDDVVTDANGAWQASGFTTGLFLGQDLSLGSLYRATPSKAGYSFDPSYYQWGGSVLR